MQGNKKCQQALKSIKNNQFKIHQFKIHQFMIYQK